MDKLAKLINEEKSQAEENRHRAIKLQTEKTLKEQKLKEMTSKVKSKNQQVNSMAIFIFGSLDVIASIIALTLCSIKILHFSTNLARRSKKGATRVRYEN